MRLMRAEQLIGETGNEGLRFHLDPEILLLRKSLGRRRDLEDRFAVGGAGVIHDRDVAGLGRALHGVELHLLLAQGVEYIYFIDEIFLPRPELLEALAARRVTIGIQTRIDLWDHAMLDLLGRAGADQLR